MPVYGGSSRRVGTEFRLHIQSAVRMNRFEGQNVNIRDALKQTSSDLKEVGGARSRKYHKEVIVK